MKNISFHYVQPHYLIKSMLHYRKNSSIGEVFSKRHRKRRRMPFMFLSLRGNIHPSSVFYEYIMPSIFLNLNDNFIIFLIYLPYPTSHQSLEFRCESIYIKTGKISTTKIKINDQDQEFFFAEGGVASILCEFEDDNETVNCHQP